METKPTGQLITVSAIVNAPLDKVWRCWNEPEHIMQWNQADAGWHCPKSINDLRVGGGFVATMAAKDGSVSFDFIATYTRVLEHELIEYTIADGRKVTVTFESVDAGTKVTEVFEMENMHSAELQKGGWQAILDSFERHTESQ